MDYIPSQIKNDKLPRRCSRGRFDHPLPGLGDEGQLLLRSSTGRCDHWPVSPFRQLARPQAAPRPQHGGHAPFLGELSERNLGPEPPPAREGIQGSASAGRHGRCGSGHQKITVWGWWESAILGPHSLNSKWGAKAERALRKKDHRRQRPLKSHTPFSFIKKIK